MFKKSDGSCQNQSMNNFPQAVSCLITFQDQFFLTKRNINMKHFPGYYSLPGGKVKSHESLIDGIIREIDEELGIKLNPQLLKAIGKAQTPPHFPYGFCTHFFHYELTKMIPMRVDKSEFDQWEWIKADHFFERYHKGEILMVPPVKNLIENFTQGRLSHPNNKHRKPSPLPTQQLPHLKVLPGIEQIFIPSPTLPPFHTTNCYIIDGIIIDPSPKDEQTLKQLVEFLKSKISRGEKLRGYFISHFHGDHHKHFDLLSAKIPLDLYINHSSYEAINQRRHQAYFANCPKIHLIKHDDYLGSWLGHNIKVIALPGHSHDMHGLFSDNQQWCFISDLYVGRSSVVVDNMQEYLYSLDTIIAMNPIYTLPSHGIVIGGTRVIERIKKHRLYREEQILKLHNEGLDVESIAKRLYHDVAESLSPYALQNVHAHLQRLKNLGKVS